MTTIAYRDGVLAADTATYLNDSSVRVPGRSSKVRKLPDGSLYSGAGVVSQIEALGRWLASGSSLEQPRFDDVTALHVRADGTVRIYDGCAEREIIDAPFYAVGTGAAAAIGAMMAGATATEAIRIAMAIDPYTAGEIDVVSLGTERQAA